jgi:hypothetical protein
MSFQTGSKQTERLISAMQKQAEASQSVADQNRELVKHAGEQAKALTVQANASQTQANASVAQAEVARQSLGAAQISARAAEQSAQAATQTFNLGERPYVSSVEGKIIDLTLGKQPSAAVTFKNNGRTPAYNVTVETTIAGLLSALPENPNYGNIPFHSTFFLPAGGQFVQTVASDTVLTDKHIDAINNGVMYVYVFGRGTYYDGLKRRYDFKFCFFYSPASPSGLLVCSQHNTSS